MKNYLSGTASFKKLRLASQSGLFRDYYKEVVVTAKHNQCRPLQLYELLQKFSKRRLRFYLNAIFATELDL